MNRKLVLIILVLIFVIVGSWWVLFAQKRSNLSTPKTDGQLQFGATQTLTVSKTNISYTDPSGFSFSYPDNLSLNKNEPKSERVYADLNLTAKGVDGELILIISDSSFTNIDEWVKANQIDSTPVEKASLGTLEAMEITTNDKIILGAYDKGVLFTIEASKGDFWKQVLNIVIKEFNFVSPTAENSTTVSSSDVVFEGEEVVE